MKKVLVSCVAALAVLAVMPSCGKGDKNGDSVPAKEERVPLEPKELTVTAIEESDGTLADNISLKEGTYTINFTDAEWGDDKYKAEVVINVTATKLPGYTDGMYLQGSEYKLVFLDENGSPIAGGDEIKASTSEMDQLLKNGGSSAITFSAGNYLKSDVVDNLVAKAKSVKLAASGTLTEMGSSSSSDLGGVVDDDDSGDDDSESSVSSSSSSSSSSNDVDEFLDEYESYIKNTEALYKKMKAGDPTAIANYAAMVGDISSLSDKIDRLKSDMTSAQLARFNRLAARAAKAAANAM